MAKKKNAPVLRNNLRNEPAEKFRTVNRMNGIVTMVEYSSEDDIKAYELEPTYRELTGGGGGGSNIPSCDVTLVHTGPQAFELYTDAFSGMLSLNTYNIIEDYESYSIESNGSLTLKFGLINGQPLPAENRVNMVGLGNVIGGVVFDTEDYSNVYTNLDNVDIIATAAPGPSGYYYTPVVVDITRPASCTLTMDFNRM